MKNFNIIVAIDSERGIGKDNDMPWHIPGELKHFKRMTTETTADDVQNAVIMGRKTWESISEKFRPLSDRINVVLTRQENLELPSGVLKVQGLEEAFEVLEKEKISSVFVIGGQQIFELAIKSPQCRKLYVTHILKDFSCDTFFPEFLNTFERVFFSSCCNEKGITYYFTEYLRKP